MKKKIKPLPKFKNEQDERDFWNTHDTTEYFDFPSRAGSKLNLTLTSKRRATEKITAKPQQVVDWTFAERARR